MVKLYSWLQNLFQTLSAPIRDYPTVMSFWLVYVFLIGLFIGLAV